MLEGTRTRDILNWYIFYWYWRGDLWKMNRGIKAIGETENGTS